MALRGKGMLITVTDVRDRDERDFNEWYNREHIDERVNLPGFRRARRYKAIVGEPRGSDPVVGALLVSGFNSLLGDAENGIHLGVTFHAPTGTRVIALGAVMTLTLLLRPTGLTKGREFSLAWLGRRRARRSSGGDSA